jgi:hypothetical protein
MYSGWGPTSSGPVRDVLHTIGPDHIKVLSVDGEGMLTLREGCGEGRPCRSLALARTDALLSRIARIRARRGRRGFHSARGGGDRAELVGGRVAVRAYTPLRADTEQESIANFLFSAHVRAAAGSPLIQLTSRQRLESRGQ